MSVPRDRNKVRIGKRETYGTLGTYIKIFTAYGQGRIAVAISLMLILSLTEGIGLLMLVPFLNLVGLNQDMEVATGIVAAVSQLFNAVGLSLTLPTVLCIYIFLITWRALLVRWRSILLSELRLGFVDHLRVRLHGAIGHANWLFLAKRRGADLTHVLTSDIERIGDGTYYFLTLMVTACVAVIHVLVAFQLSALMTVIALLTGGCLLLLLGPQIRRARRLGEQLTEADRNIFRTVAEFLDGIKLAKSYGVEDRYCQAFSQAVTLSRKRALNFTRRNARVMVIYQFSAALILSGLLYIAAELVKLPAAELLVLVLVFARLLPMLSRMQLDYQGILYMLPAFGSALAMLRSCETAVEHLPVDDSEKPILQKAIQLRQVSFGYDGQVTKPALADISLVIPAHQTTALVGASGAGKSTLADLLMGLLTPSIGEILVDDKLLIAERIRLWRNAVAYVPQDTFLFHDTVRANLRWARPNAQDDELWQVLEWVAADRFVAKLSAALDTVIGDRGIRLSGGERQRLALARALLRRPSLLILDEATSALDNEHERRIQQSIDALHGSLTIVVIAHRLSTVRHADQIIVLDEGRVVETGTWHELEARKQGRLRALWQAAEVV